ncbi:MAG TPA: methyl-accepting chemotaxis protein [Magnetospirillum sp.]|nr:methyl-accepting chemotaxis protein [Magnetospirillum sp.]
MNWAFPSAAGSQYAVNDLTEIAASIEGVFVQAGERLGDAVGRWRIVSSSFSTLAEQYDSDEMRRCVDELRSALSVVGSLGARDGRSTAGQLAELGCSLAAMRARLVRLRKTLGEVKLVALNAKVEAAHLDADRNEFSVFTGEIDRLVIDAESELTSLDGELQILASQTAAAHQAQAGFESGHGSELQAVCLQLDAGLRRLADQRRRISGAAGLIGQRSAQAADHVGELVLALQIGDITRQRAEHVGQALQLLDSLDATAPSLTAEDMRQAAALLTSLQAGQLEQAATDLDHEAAQVSSNLNALAREAQEVGRQGNESFSGVGGTSFLEALAAEIARIDTLFEGYSAALDGTRLAMRAVTTATASMVAHVEAIHSIEADLKIMGLNASLKCGRLGDRGRTLSVVAQNLRQLANRTVEDAGALMAGLNSITTTAQSLAHREDTDTGTEDARTNLHRARTLLSANGANQKEALRILEEESAKVQSALNEAVANITGANELSRRMRTVANRLKEATKDVVVPPERIEHLKGLVLGNLTGNYTMASERALHDLFSGTASAAPSAAAEVAVDDLLF